MVLRGGLLVVTGSLMLATTYSLLKIFNASENMKNKTSLASIVYFNLVSRKC